MSEIGILPQPIPFGKYYLLERVNVGGMAEIFKAKAFGVEGFERLLAVKRILATIAEDESFINMFIDEAKIAGQLNHPNIAQIFDLGKVEDDYFIALEYIAGKDMKTIFERSRRLGEKVSVPRVCYEIMKVCEGLGHAHDKRDAQGNELNIVHRDVSPQNILISYEGEVKIIDFGIAKAQGKTSQTQVGILKGKFSYMSPEQVRGLHIDHRSDLFSLGIVLYELLTLERLFLGESDFDTLEKIRKVEMSPPSLFNPHIPKELEDIVLKSLAKSPEDRFQTAYEFADALEQFMRHQGYYYTNKDLGAYMRESFRADIEFENKKVEYYRSLNLRAPVDAPRPGMTPSQPAAAIQRPGGLSWGDDELDTQIFGRDDEDEEDSLNESDIVYAADVIEERHADPPTVEFNRAAIQQGLDAMVFESDRARVDPRHRQPTAQMPSIEVRRDSPVTVTHQLAAPPQQRRSGAPITLAVMVLVVLVGAVGIYLLWPFPAVVDFNPTPASNITVVVDGETVFQGDGPYTGYKIKPGKHSVEIRSEGYEPYTLTQDFQKGQPYKITRSLKPSGEQTPPALAPGTPQLTLTPPDALVEVDGKKFEGATSPRPLTGLKAGSYTATITRPGFEPATQTIKLADGEAPPALNVALKPLTLTLKLDSSPSKAAYTVYNKTTNERVARGKTPDTIKGLTGDKLYKVVVESSGYETWTDELVPDRDVNPTLTATLEREAVAAVEPNPDTRRDPPPRKEPTPQRAPKPVVVRDPDPEPAVRKDPPPRKDPPKAVGVATLTIASKPVARVFIDGKDTGRFTPLIDFKISSERHKIELVNEEFGLRKVYYEDFKEGESKKIINRPD